MNKFIAPENQSGKFEYKWTFYEIITIDSELLILIYLKQDIPINFWAELLN